MERERRGVDYNLSINTTMALGDRLDMTPKSEVHWSVLSPCLIFSHVDVREWNGATHPMQTHTPNIRRHVICERPSCQAITHGSVRHEEQNIAGFVFEIISFLVK